MSNGTGKKIAFVSARSAFIKYDSSFIMYWADARLLNEIIKYFHGNISVAIFSNPVASSKYSVEVIPPKLYQLPFPFSYAGGLRNSVKIYRVLKKIEKEHDALVVQLPFIGFLPLLAIKKPVLFHICANVVTGGENKVKYRGLKYAAAFAFSRIIHTVFKSLFKRKGNQLIVNGDELRHLYQKFSPQMVISSSIYRHEIIKQSQIARRAKGEAFKLLFIGRPTVDKGYLVLIQAFSKLIDDGENVTLTVIGATKEELPAICGFEIEEKYFSKIECVGYLTWGEVFRKTISDCHVLVMSSLSSEGTPRVLIEARALGCPVIATDVGGVRSSVTHEKDGMIVPIGNPELIGSTCKRLMLDEEFRQMLIKNGLGTVKNFTVERFAEEMIDSINKLVAEK